MKNPWKTLKNNIIYEDRFGYRLRQDDVITPKQTEGKYTVFESQGYVIIIPIDKDGNVFLIRQWRYTIEEESLEVPAGTIERDGLPLDTAKRELLEELGAMSSEWIPLGAHWLGNGVMRIKGHVFLARNVEIQSEKHLDDTEELNTESLPFSKAVNMILSGEFMDERTQLGLLLADKYLQNNKENKK